MIELPTVEKRVVRGHYDIATLFYRLLWGNHIHHGYWHADESPEQAQLQLTEHLRDWIGIRSGDRVLDIGCGMGGSSIHLARGGAKVTGITLSHVQRRWATVSAGLAGVGGATEFHVADADNVTFADDSFDAAWSIECTEHVFDKPKLFRNIAKWVRPGGRVGICAWLAGPKSETIEGRKLVERVCDDFFCPGLGTADDYVGWMRAAGMRVETPEICTEKVLRTWEICKERTERFRIRSIAKLIDKDSVRFLDAFGTILEAYRTRAMDYGIFVATNPCDETDLEIPQSSTDNGTH